MNFQNILPTQFLRILDRRSAIPIVRQLARADRLSPPAIDPGPETTINACIRWLVRAQECSTDKDGGFARHYSLKSGWGRSYPETSGYIIPTLINHSRRTGDQTALDSARRALDWLVSIQMSDGAFQGGTIGAEPCVPVTFNTGQILIGLAAGATQFGDSSYHESMRAAAEWLIDTQDEDGAWRRHATPFAAPGDKTYETHVAWGLFEAAMVANETRWMDAGLRNVRWAISNQRSNGWFDHCCLERPEAPLTHTIGYAIRGILEAHRHDPNDNFLEAAKLALDGISNCITKDGQLAGRLDCSWRPQVYWTCLTGSAQLAHCFLMAWQATGENRYRNSAFALNCFVRRTINFEATPDKHGAIRGSWPIEGAYGRFEYLNWAAKFTIDANLLELEVKATGS